MNLEILKFPPRFYLKNNNRARYDDINCFMMLLIEHHAEVVPIYTMKSLQNHSALVFINYIIISTYPQLDSL
jgi:hypothetical protein